MQVSVIDAPIQKGGSRLAEIVSRAGKAVSVQTIHDPGKRRSVEIRKPILSMTTKPIAKRSHHFALLHYAASPKALVVSIKQMKNLFFGRQASHRVAAVPGFDMHSLSLLAGFAEFQNCGIANVDPCLARRAAFADPRVKVISARAAW
jgi:hypothetical protein